MAQNWTRLWRSAKEVAQDYWYVIPQPLGDTLLLRSLGVLRIPMIAFLSPSVVSSDHRRSEVRIPLTYRSRNHLGSMYFGAIAVGADTVVGLQAIKHLQHRRDVHLIFKDFSARFLKRAEGDTHFICDEGEKIKALVRKAISGTERVEETIAAYATVPSLFGEEKVAVFELTLSLKRKSPPTN